MKEALFYEKSEHKDVKCLLCPHECLIRETKSGICRVRKNISGVLYSENFGKISSINFDPIEKKPLYHFFPGASILSIGTVGCNLKCQFCQNCEISQSTISTFPYLLNLSSKEIIDKALNHVKNIGIAYTYNEPVIWFEFMLETAKEAKSNNLKNVMVTNGYINQKPLEILCEYIDAFNIDLKAFDNDFYKKLTQSELQPVLNTLKTIKKKNIHFEITNLIIPSQNDNLSIFSDMINWIEGELGKETVLHLSRYFPRYKMNILSTPSNVLIKMFEIAKSKLSYVYLGNMHGNEGSDTYCSSCKKKVIIRDGYLIKANGIDEAGNCIYCHHPIINN